VFVARPDALLDDGKLTYEQAAAASRVRLDGVLAEIRGGTAPDAAAQKHGFPKGQYSVMAEGRFLEPGAPTASKEADAWAFDPARRPGDVGVFEGLRGTIMGFAVLEVRAARARTYEEVVPDLIALIRSVRLQRFQLQHQLECVAAATILPIEISEELQNEVRGRIQDLDKDPVRRDIRLR
jgi:hypothetical protein